MKVGNNQTQRLNILISKEAKLRLGELQVKLRAQAENLNDRETTPGKLIEKLILYKDIFEVLQKEFGLCD